MPLRPNGLRALAIIGSACLLAVAAFAKDKSPLPEWVLRAHTVAVVLDPDAGISVGDPNANQTAQKDVETALLNWGRFEPVMGTQGADLIIVLRKGHGKLAEETLPIRGRTAAPASSIPSITASVSERNTELSPVSPAAEQTMEIRSETGELARKLKSARRATRSSSTKATGKIPSTHLPYGGGQERMLCTPMTSRP